MQSDSQTTPAAGGDPLDGKPCPPDGLVPRLKFYGRRNGYLYAALSFVGRRSYGFWNLVAPAFTGRKVREWLTRPGPHYVNLGGGANIFDRWLTADMDPRADVYVNITKPLPFPDQSIDAVYLEEVIEHIPSSQGVELVAECRRVLKPGGAIRLTTPCLDLFCERFEGGLAWEEKFNDIFYNHGHRHIFTKAGIKSLLETSGFREITESSFRDPYARFGYFDTHALRIAVSDEKITQYWEAVR